MITSHFTRTALALSFLLSLTYSLSAASDNSRFVRAGRCIMHTGKIAAGCANIWIARNCTIALMANYNGEQAELMNYPLIVSLPLSAVISIKSGVKGLAQELRSQESSNR